ncbi:AraC family transcriptional regulator [Pseudomaricurvus alkylphenolicus]|uniref:AraC family transcriptional regulator n=1 Tax=Pseudomaricurvus alkylphenolicus TaxID=1306991 RepID=UPI001421D142|nr:AraC family transcriptional regulator [Pseudomaricurvus alkylphenolicus]NIB43687.1 AraC family transcriptional regulator [Pseudomaricurvus alkylphenolicus]
MADNIPSYILEGIAGLIEQAGQDPVAIAKSVELNPAALYQPDILVNEIKINDLFEEAAQVCGDRFFGVRAGQLKGLDMIGPLWLLAQQASSIVEVLTLLSENMTLHSQGFSMLVKDEGDAGVSLAVEIAKLRLDLFQTAPKNTGVTQVVEHSMTIICRELRGSLGFNWFPRYVQFRHCAPEDISQLQRVFGEHLYFNQDVNAIHLSREDAQAPNYRNPDNTISNEAKKLVSRNLEASIGQGMSFVQRVERIIRTLINDQGVTAKDVANTLNIPLRTLQYRLKKHNTSYQALYDKVREELAKHYLAKSELSVSAIAERLHFNDTAAMSKFFKSRTGFSPSEYARRMR